MAITVNNTQSSLTKTLSYTPSNVSDSCLVVCVAGEDVSNNNPLTAVSFGATPMVIAINAAPTGANANDSLIAYLVNPGTSAQTITVAGGETGRTGLTAVTLGNVDQTTALDVTGFTIQAASNPPHQVSATGTTTQDNTKIITTASFSVGSGVLGITGGVVLLADVKPGGTVDLGMAHADQPTAGLFSYTWTHDDTLFGNQRFTSASAAFNQAVSGSVDSLLADDVKSTATVSSPAIGQTHALLANGVKSQSTVSATTIGQVHILLSDGVKSAPSVSSASLSTGGTDALLADNVKSLATVSSPSIGQAHVLTADGVKTQSTAQSAVIGQTHVLLANGVSSQSTVSSASINRSTIPTPSIRSLTISAESRTMTIDAESRALTVSAESRTMKI